MSSSSAQIWIDRRRRHPAGLDRFAREQEKVGLQQALLEGQVGLATLAGAGMPQFAIEPEAAPADPFGVFREVAQ